MSAPESPTRVNRYAIRADSAAIRTSHAVAMTAPAPATVPLSAPITGCRHCRIAAIRSHVIRVNSSSPSKSRSKSAPMMSSTSPPLQNPLPAPVITTARTSGSPSSARNVFRSSS